MSFAHPAILLLLAVPIALALWEWTRQGPRVRVPFDHARLPPGRWRRRLLGLAQLLPPALLAAAVVLLAGPQQPGRPETERRLTNIELCLDVSGSMMSPFGDGSRYDAAMAAIADFTEARAGDACGLTIFGNEVMRWTPLTQDLQAIRQATPFVRPELLPHHFGGTEIGKALRFCRERLLRTDEGDRLVILLSDGWSADLDGDRAALLGRELRADGIVAYAIHVGDEAAPAALYEVCAPTGGDVFAAGDLAALHGVFAYIDRMRPARFESKAPRPADAFAWPALAGAIALVLHTVASLRWRYTPW